MSADVKDLDALDASIADLEQSISKKGARKTEVEAERADARGELDEAEAAFLDGDVGADAVDRHRRRRETLDSALERLDEQMADLRADLRETRRERDREAALRQMEEQAGRAATSREEQHASKERLAEALQEHTGSHADAAEKRAEATTAFRAVARRLDDTPEALAEALEARGVDLAGVLPRTSRPGRRWPAREPDKADTGSWAVQVRQACARTANRRRQ